MIVFQNRDVDGAAQLWIKSLAQGDPLQITFFEDEAERPCWSPKGDEILFNRRGGIWSVPPLGGQPRPLIQPGSNPSFSRDGEHVVYETPDWGIWLTNADGGTPRWLASRALPWPATPALSPDAERIAYFQSDDGGPSGDFWVISTSGGTPRRLTFDSSFGGRPVWTPDGRFIIFSSMRHGSENLWRVPASGGAPETVTFGAGQDGDPAVSPDGKRLIYTNTRTAYALMLRDAVTGNETEPAGATGAMDFPRFSHQGDRIAFF